jgi:long-chain acyl-CoA synthetase
MNHDAPLEKISRRLALQTSRFPHKTFLIDLASGRRLTFREFDELVGRACGYFKSLGLAKGDLLSAVLDNSIELCLLFFAALRFGAVFNPYPAFLIAADVRRDIDALRPRALILPGERRDEFETVAAEKIFIEMSRPGGFLDSLRAFPPAPVEAPALPDDTAFIYHSAGRLVDPRGIRYSHGNLMSLIPAVARGLNLGADDVHLIVLPLAHTAALNYSLFPCAWLGATAVLAGSFWGVRERFWDIAAEFAATYVQVVPTALYILLHQQPRPGAGHRLSHIACGSAALAPALRAEFERTVGLPVADLYGLAETGPTHTDAVWTPGWKRGTIGRPLDCNDVAILDAGGNALPAGATGEIAVRGGNVFPGYAIHPELTAAHFRNGWFLTGDRGLIDADGYHHFLGLKKKLIIRGGVNIHPGEIDEVLGTHPDVAKVVTRGTPDDFFGELIRSDISVREGSRLTEAALKDYCRGRLSPIKIPDFITIG